MRSLRGQPRNTSTLTVVTRARLCANVLRRAAYDVVLVTHKVGGNVPGQGHAHSTLVGTCEIVCDLSPEANAVVPQISILSQDETHMRSDAAALPFQRA